MCLGRIERSQRVLKGSQCVRGGWGKEVVVLWRMVGYWRVCDEVRRLCRDRPQTLGMDGESHDLSKCTEYKCDEYCPVTVHYTTRTSTRCYFDLYFSREDMLHVYNTTSISLEGTIQYCTTSTSQYVEYAHLIYLAM
jgi:hypothetical protein